MVSSINLTSFPSARNDATESSYAKIAAGYQQDGLIWEVGSAACFGDSTGMHVKIPSGRGVISGAYGDWTSTQTLDIATADATNPRIDRVVLRRTSTSPVTMSLAVLTGTPATSPVAPALANDATHIDSPIARISVGAGVSTIASGNVILERVFSGVTTGTFSPTVGVAGGSSFSVSSQTIVAAELNYQNMMANIFIEAQVALTGSNPGSLSVTLPWPALHDSVLLHCDYAGDLYRCGTSTFGNPQVLYAAINPQANQTFTVDGVARTLIVTGTYKLTPD